MSQSDDLGFGATNVNGSLICWASLLCNWQSDAVGFVITNVVGRLVYWALSLHVCTVTGSLMCWALSLLWYLAV